MANFIKLHLKYDGTEAYVNMDRVSDIETSIDGVCILDTGKIRYSVSESAEQVIKLIEAKKNNADAIEKCIQTLMTEFKSPYSTNDYYIYGVKICIEKLKEVLDGNQDR